MWGVLSRPFVLVSISAIGYAAATFAMKSASSMPGVLVVTVIACCLGAAVMAEILLLRSSHFGLAYLAILGTETLIILIAATLIGEGLGLRELAGAGLVLLGAGIIST